MLSVVKSFCASCITKCHTNRPFINESGLFGMYKRYKLAMESVADSSTSASLDAEVRLDSGAMNQASPSPEPNKPKHNKSFKSAVVIIPPEAIWEPIQEIRKLHDKGYVRWMPHISMLYPFVADTNDGEDFASAAEKFKAALEGVKPFKVKLSTFMYFKHKKYCTLWLKPEPEFNDEVADEVDAAKAVEDRTSVQESLTTSTAASGACANAPENVDDMATTETTASQPVKSKSQLKKEAKKRLIQERKMAELEKLGPSHPGVVEVQRILESQFPKCNDVSVISEKGFTPHLSVGQFSPKDVEDFKDKFGASWQTIEFDVKDVHLISREDFDDPFHIRQTVTLGR